MISYLHTSVTRVDDGFSQRLHVIGPDPVRLTFPDGGTLDLAAGQAVMAQAVQTEPRGTTKCGVERRLKPKPEPTTGWEWVRDSMRRGNEAASRRAAEFCPNLPGEVEDYQGDHWVLTKGCSYSTVWASPGDYYYGWSYQRLSEEYGPLTVAGDA